MCGNLLELGRDIRELEIAGIDAWHIDIMDGVFVPNFALSFDVIKALKSVTRIPIEAHLMVKSPEQHIEQCASAGVDCCVFHIETTRFPIRLADHIHKLGMKAGVAINPSTSARSLEYVLDRLDHILVMTVEPGFAGQRFIDATLPKISEIAAMAKGIKRSLTIQVDGNMNVENAAKSLKAGATSIVAGTSSVFRSDDTLANNLAVFRQAVSSYV